MTGSSLRSCIGQSTITCAGVIALPHSPLAEAAASACSPGCVACASPNARAAKTRHTSYTALLLQRMGAVFACTPEPALRDRILAYTPELAVHSGVSLHLPSHRPRSVQCCSEAA